MMLPATPRRASLLAGAMALLLVACGAPKTQGDGGSTPVPDAGPLDSGPPPDAGPNPCLVTQTPCQPHATCSDSNGVAVCTCNASQGYIPDISHPNTCVQNPCAGNPCGSTAFCTDEGSGTHECTCDTDAGLLGNCIQVDGGVDVCTCVGDNCVQPDGGHLGSCAPNMDCASTPGGVTCTCSAGFIDGGSMICEPNSCANSTACQANASCANSESGPICTCLPGYDTVTLSAAVDGGAPDGGDAGPLDEGGDGGVPDAGPIVTVCQIHDYCNDPVAYCDTNAMCSYDPTLGTTCTCNSDAGYTGSGRPGMCMIMVPECQQGSCPQNAVCTNTSTGFTCACPTGFDTTDAGDCVGHNFCNDTDAGSYCDAIATCNYDGGSSCACPSGMIGTGLALLDGGCYPALTGSVSVGGTTGCALTAGGELYCWGGNDQGQLATGESACLSGEASQYSDSCPSLVGAADVPAGSSWIDVAVGRTHVCGIQALSGTTAGTLWCWGRDDSGQLGYGIQGLCTASMAPVILPAMPQGLRWVRVKAGAYDTCALDDSQHLWCWGANNYGQLGNGTTLSEQTLDGGAGYGFGVLPELIQVGDNVPTWTDFAVGDIHMCAIQTDGSLWCWGRDADGELGDGPGPGGSPLPDEYSPILIDDSPPGWASVAAGGSTTPMTCAIKTDQTLWCWGSDSLAALGVSQGQSFDGGASCATPYLNLDGVYDIPSPSCVGFGDSWNGAQWSAVAIGAFSGTMCALRANPDDLGREGTVWCSGQNGSGQAGVREPPSIAAGPLEVDFPDAGLITPQFPMISISSGYQFACSLDSASQVWCWGDDSWGQHGDCEALQSSSGYVPTPLK